MVKPSTLHLLPREAALFIPIRIDAYRATIPVTVASYLRPSKKRLAPSLSPTSILLPPFSIHHFMDTNKIKVILIVILAAFASIYLGISAATEKVETIAWVVGVGTLATCLFLGRRIWLLIPLMSAVDISIRLPGQPSTLLVAQFLVIGFSVLLLLMRRLPFRLRFTELEVWMLVITLFVVQVYVRNPVSVSIFGGDSVGGKPYAIFALSLVTAALLAGLSVPHAELKTALRLSIIGGIINFGASLLGRFVPTVGFIIGVSYVDTSVKDYSKAGVAVDTTQATREGSLVTLGRNLSLWVCSFRSPLKACFHPLWCGLILLSLAAALMSGFRNSVLMVGFTYFLGLCYRGGMGAVMTSMLGGVMALALLAVVNSAAPLPPNIQRSLSFLPGTWEKHILVDAEGSNEWRFEIWKEVLTSEKWITNKWMGDGLGFSLAELQYQMSTRIGTGKGLSGFDAHRESILSSGDYHSGPIQTVRVIGYFGLVVLILFQIRLAVHAHRQILRCRNTEWFPLALLLGIPLIWNPIFFVFVFGTFKTAAETVFLGAAMIRLLENNLPLPPWIKPTRSAYLLRTGVETSPHSTPQSRSAKH